MGEINNHKSKPIHHQKDEEVSQKDNYQGQKKEPGCKESFGRCLINEPSLNRGSSLRRGAPYVVCPRFVVSCECLLVWRLHVLGVALL
jgi:hypothetical protein